MLTVWRWRGWCEDLEGASLDLLRQMVTTLANALMSAEADAVCGVPYGVASADRVNQRNGYLPQPRVRLPQPRDRLTQRRDLSKRPGRHIGHKPT